MSRQLNGWHPNKPFKYIDVVRTKKGKLRTWKGYLRALQKMDGLSNKEVRDMEKKLR